MRFFMHAFVQAMICAWGFGSWSIVRKLFGVSTGFAMVILTIIQIPAALWLWKLFPDASSVRNISLFTMFGAIPNGIAIVSLGYLLRQEGEVITTWVPVMNAAMLIVAFVGGALLLGERITAPKAAGAVMICLGIAVMSIKR